MKDQNNLERGKRVESDANEKGNGRKNSDQVNTTTLPPSSSPVGQKASN